MNTTRIARLDVSQRRLAADLEAAAAFAFHQPYQEYVCGHWLTCMLWNRTGSAEEKLGSDYEGRAIQTPYGAALPYLTELMEQTFHLDTLRCARLVKIMPGTVLVPHVDFHAYEKRTNYYRVHLPLQTDMACFHGQGDVVFHMPVGEVWYLDATQLHSAASFSDSPRIHLMLDFAESGEVGTLFRTEINRHPDIPSENIVGRSVLTEADNEALRSLHRVIDRDNYKDVLAILIRTYFRKKVPASAALDWLVEIATLSGDTVLSDTVVKLRSQCFGQPVSPAEATL